MMDIDHFKVINDTHGHLVGDDVLKEISKILLELTRQSDIVVRYGGEEFIVLLPNTKIKGALSIANKIHTTIGDFKIPINNNILKFTISIGVAECDWKAENTIDSIIYSADKLLYEAKNSGRNRVVSSHF